MKAEFCTSFKTDSTDKINVPIKYLTGAWSQRSITDYSKQLTFKYSFKGIHTYEHDMELNAHIASPLLFRVSLQTLKSN